MNQASRGSRAVFVGNIPFEYTEEQLIDVFKEVGPVSSFRLLFDRDTGRPKGYGFCEFYDSETASSAVRNLNNYEIGGRQLRVDYASMDDNGNRSNNKQNNSNNNNNQFTPQQQSNVKNENVIAEEAPPPPPPVARPPIAQAPPPAVTAADIPRVLSSMNRQDLLATMAQMKQLSMEQPDYARDFLTSNPQVTYALFHALTVMNVVDPNIISQLMLNSNNPQAPPVTSTPVQPVDQSMQMPPSMTQGMQPPPPQPQPQQPQGMYPQGLPPQGVPPQNMPPPQGMPPNTGAIDAAAAEQKALLMQVLQLSEEQINNLQPEYREQVRQLRAQLSMQQQP
ncbi:hypothetical protein [Absidia glauca]|uniref:RRM domain-containing protein n=1 Tax=Absidia glauca TaxID=4829 RepID=A0A163JML3_ABSGL|nr:hypothetical protein [Absidia glauca]